MLAIIDYFSCNDIRIHKILFCFLNVQSLAVVLITICATTNDNLLVKFSLTAFTYMSLLKNVLWTLIDTSL